MKVQMQAQDLRLRLQEAEFAQLLVGETIENRTALPAGAAWVLQLRLAHVEQAHCEKHGDAWMCTLPAAEVHAFAQRLPTRDGLHFELTAEGREVLHVTFDVDTRDIARNRKMKDTAGDQP